MHVNIISESQFSPSFYGGVHTAFLSHRDALHKKKEITFSINAFGKADVIHIHSFGPFGLYKLLTSKPTVVTSHVTPETHAGTFNVGKYGLLLTKSYLKFFYNRANLIIALNTEEKAELKALGVHQKIAVIPNPINTDIFRQESELRKRGRKQFNISTDAVVILSVGHVVLRKGIKDFILLAKSFPKYTFIWVGGNLISFLGAETVEQKNMIKNAPKNFILTGNISYKDMPLFYNMADVFLFPSYKELASMAILEAAACGLPLILRDLPAYKELYQHNYIPAKNNEEFAAALSALFTKKGYYRKMVERSKSLRDSFSRETIGKRLLEAYKNVIKDKNI